MQGMRTRFGYMGLRGLVIYILGFGFMRAQEWFRIEGFGGLGITWDLRRV